MTGPTGPRMPSVPKRPGIYGAGVGVGVGPGSGAWIVTETVPGLISSTSTPSGRPLSAGVSEYVPGARPEASTTGVTSDALRPESASPAPLRVIVSWSRAGRHELSPAPMHTIPTTKVRLDTDGPIVAVTVTV